MVVILKRPGIVSPYRGSQRPLWPFAINEDSPQHEGLVAWYPLGPCGMDHGVARELVAGNVATSTNLSGAGVTTQTDPNLGLYCTQGGSDTGTYSAPDVAQMRITGELTISLWVRGSSSGQQNKGFIAKYQSGTSNRAWAFNTENVSAGKKCTLYYQSNGASFNSAQTTTSTSNVLDGTWHHVIGTFLPSTRARIYVDGNLDTNKTTSIPSSIFSSTCTIDLFRQNVDNANSFSGDLTDIRVYAKYTDDALAWQMYDPRTRWDLYYPLGRKVHSFAKPAGAGGGLVYPQLERGTRGVSRGVCLGMGF